MGPPRGIDPTIVVDKIYNYIEICRQIHVHREQTGGQLAKQTERSIHITHTGGYGRKTMFCLTSRGTLAEQNKKQKTKKNKKKKFKGSTMRHRPDDQSHHTDG